MKIYQIMPHREIMKNINIVSLLSIFIAAPVLGMGSGFVTRNFDQAGVMNTKNVSLAVKEVFNLTGRIIAQELFECHCGTMIGDGYIKGDIIKIVAHDFEFKGIIECEGECTIITSKPFDQSICTFQGSGSFDFIVDQDAYSRSFGHEPKMKKVSKTKSIAPITESKPVDNALPLKRETYTITSRTSQRNKNLIAAACIAGVALFVTAPILCGAGLTALRMQPKQRS